MKHFPPSLWWISALVCTGTILYLGSQPGSDLPKVTFPGLDKLVHFTAYASLATCVFRAVYHPSSDHESLRGKKAGLVLGLPFLVALIDEFNQAFVPGRSSDWKDILADMAGALSVLLIGLWNNRSRDHN